MQIERLLFLCFFLLFPAVFSGAEPAAIAIPDGAAPMVFPPGGDVRYAADFLNGIFQKTTGKRLPVISEKEAEKFSKSGVIYVGATKFARKHAGDPEKFQPEALRILPAGKDVILCGEVSPDGVDRGTLFAVYEYAERTLGVRWFYPDDARTYPAGFGTVFPPAEHLPETAPDVYDFPRFQRRTGGVSHYAWPLKKQIAWHPVLRFGASISKHEANHTQIAWYALYAETHPEYFAVRADGKRIFNTRLPHRNYICPAQPEVLARMIANLEAFDLGTAPENAWGPCPPDKQRVYFSFNDGMLPETMCACAACRAKTHPERAYAGQSSEWAFEFITRYAEAIAEKWPRRRLSVLAYQHYQAPPEQVKIPANVDVTFVTKSAHRRTGNGAEKARLELWSARLGGNRARLGVWLNIVDPVKYTSKVPFFYPHLLKDFLSRAQKIADSVFINGMNPEINRLGVENRLDAYSTYPMVWIQSRLMWNPDRDPDAILRDFTHAMYGPGADAMTEFFNLAAERWEKIEFDPESGADEKAFIHRVRGDARQTAAMRALLDRAAESCAPDSMERRRIEFYRDRIFARFEAESRAFHAQGQQGK